ncbi:MAG: PAS domain S-box protein [Bacteroidota bacterium]
MSVYTFLSGVLCGFFLLTSFFSLFLYFRRIESKLNISYFFLALFLNTALTLGLATDFIGDVTQSIYYDKLVNSFLTLAGIAFLFMISYMTGYKSRRFLTALVVGLGIFLGLNWILPYGVTWELVTGTAARESILQESRYVLVGQTGAMNIASMLVIVGIAAYAVAAIRFQLLHGDRIYARRLLIVAFIALTGVLLDIILLEFQMKTIGLIDDAGFLGLALLVGHRNILNLIRTNNIIRENEERLAQLTEAAFEGIAFSENGRIVDVNHQLASMLGYNPEEMIGRPVIDFVDSASVSTVLEREQRSLDESYEHLARHKDGHAIPVEVNVKNAVLRDRVIRVSAIRDLSERMKSEAQNTLLAKTIKSVRDCISVTDLENRLLFVNDAFLQAYGYTEAEVLGRPMSMFRSKEEVRVSEADIRLIVQDEEEWYGELLNKRKDGSVFPIELWATSVKDTDGNTVAYVGVARDISERKRDELALVSAKERAERSDRLKDAFIANISHEVRTPLNIIVGYTGLISECMVSKASDEEMQYFDSVQRGAQRLMRTVDMILSISRLEVGDFELQVRPLNLADVVQQMVDDYSSASQAKNITLSFTNEMNNAEILADEYCIVQSLHNLMDNALKYTEKGSIKVRVFRGESGKICMSISDTGVGISPEYLDSVFQPYTQEDTGYSRSYDGIGLGLSLVKRYAELNKASVELESAKGSGTTVTMSFPATPGAAEILMPDSPPERVEESASEPETKMHQPISLLLVEDDSLTVEFMRTILSRQFTVHTSASAEEAVVMLGQHKIDLILMDISLSGEKNGIELTMELKASPEWAHIPIVAATAHAFPEDRQHCLDAGCDEYISKPIRKDQLIAIIDRLNLTRRHDAARNS